jgi:hypothetical protein
MRFRGASIKEDAMRKALFFLLVVVFAFAGYRVQSTVAQEKEGKAAVEKQGRWRGSIVNINKDKSSIEVRRGDVTRTVYYDSSTKWTEGTKTVDMSAFTAGVRVVCLGTYDEKGELHATRIDLTPK